MIRDPETGRHWGTAAQIAAALGRDVTIAMVRNWAARDGLEAVRDGRAVYYPLDQAVAIERDKRLSKEETGKGRPRRLDARHALAA